VFRLATRSLLGPGSNSDFGSDFDFELKIGISFNLGIVLMISS